MLEIPRNDAAQFSLPVVAALNSRSSHVRPIVKVQPLLAEHCQEGRKERNGETGEEDGLDLDNCLGRTGPLWESGNIVSKGGVVDLVEKDAK